MHANLKGCFRSLWLAADLLCLVALTAKFLPSLDPILARQISTSLSTFVFSSSNDSALAFDFSMLNNSSADEPSRLDPEDIINPTGDDSGAHDFFDDDDGGGGGGFDVYDGDIDNDGDNGAPGMSMVAGGSGGAYESFDPSRGNERDMFMAMVGGGGEDGADEAGEMFGYFDKDLLGKNWVGRPEHWKMRRQVVKKGMPASFRVTLSVPGPDLLTLSIIRLPQMMLRQRPSLLGRQRLRSRSTLRLRNLRRLGQRCLRPAQRRPPCSRTPVPPPTRPGQSPRRRRRRRPRTRRPRPKSGCCQTTSTSRRPSFSACS